MILLEPKQEQILKREIMGIIIKGEIERVNGKELSYIEFVDRYMEKNKPVVITGLMDHWRAHSDWVTLHSQPNFQFFSTHFGASKVQVYSLYNAIKYTQSMFN